MADKDPQGDGPSLELPSFGFGRKKRAKQAEPAPVEPTTPAPEPAVPEPEPVPAPEPEPVPVVTTPASSRAEPAQSAAEPQPDTQPTRPRPRRELSWPAISALRAALVVGALIGLLAVLLTFASLKLCELVRGTDACGGPGLLLLVATLVILTYAGSWLLRGFGIDDPGSTSFLAVGLLAVMVMVFLLDVIYSWWMVIVIPLVAMATYALSWWVTTRFVEDD